MWKLLIHNKDKRCDPVEMEVPEEVIDMIFLHNNENLTILANDEDMKFAENKHYIAECHKIHKD